jgi:hypothetical protein
MRQFLAVLRSFFRCSLSNTSSCHCSPPTILPSPSHHLAIYFLIYVLVLFPISYIIPFWEFCCMLFKNIPFGVIKVKCKVVLPMLWRCIGVATLSRNLGHFIPRKEPQYPLNRRLGGPQAQSEYFGEENGICTHRCIYSFYNLQRLGLLLLFHTVICCYGRWCLVGGDTRWIIDVKGMCLQQQPQLTIGNINH